MNEYSEVLSKILKQCTRQPIGEVLIGSEADLRNDLGIDSLGLLMLFERIGNEFNIDPVKLNKKNPEIRQFGDLLERVSVLCKERRGV